MKGKTPRFYLDGPLGCKTLGAVKGQTVLAGFSSDSAASAYCENDAAQLWELHSLRSGDHRRIDPGNANPSLLVAIDPASPSELSLLAATLETVAAAIECGQDSTAIACRLVRDCAKETWRSRQIVESDVAQAGRWYVACRCPPHLAPVCGAPMWYWSEWFDGKHVRTEYQCQEGISVDQVVFSFHSEKAAEEFCIATVARLDGTVRHCYVDTYGGDGFEVVMWEDGKPARAHTPGKIGERVAAAS